MSTEPSFSSIIDQLREENAKPSQQLQEATRKAEAEHEQRKLAEEGNSQSHSYQSQLEKDVQRYAGVAAFFQGIVTRCATDMERVLPTLQDMRKNMSEGTIWQCTIHQA